MIKIVHTADLHFGIEYTRYANIADKLKEERLNALKLIVDRCNKEGVHAIVVAGDLFEKLTISQRLIKEVKSVLAEFEGEVFVISGNHDWYNPLANDNKLWNCFIDAPGHNVHFLKEQTPYNFLLNNQKVVIYPCGCHQKHYSGNLLKWVKEEKKDEDAINIGIAHGNVIGYGLDDEGNYFTMSPNELSDAGLDIWLLGHIHAPYPNMEEVRNEKFYFAGNHCPDSLKSERSGGAWLIEIEDKKKIKAKRWSHNGICFRDRSYNINSVYDVENTISELMKMNASQTILRLRLYGSLIEEDLEGCKMRINDISKKFLYCEPITWNIGLKITSESIDKLYPKNSIPHILLSTLSDNQEDELAMQLAYQTIKSLNK